jgi:autotransporter-associated beta strand protein
MRPMRRVPSLIPAFLGFAVLALSLQAQVVNYTWIAAGDGTNDDFANPANWADGQVPLNSPDSRWVFPVGEFYYDPEVVTLSGGVVNLDSMYLYEDYPGVSYQFSSTAPTTLVFAPDGGSYGQSSNNIGYSRTLVFDASITLDFATDQYWTASSLTFDGAAGGAGRFRYLPHSFYSEEFYNTGTLTLNGPGNFTGGFETSNVNLYLNHESAVAGGTLYLTDTRIFAADGYVLDNPMEVAGRFETEGALSLTGPVTLNSDVRTAGNFSISGDIGESSEGTELAVTFGSVRLSGTNTYTGGTRIGDEVSVWYPPYFYYTSASVIFENASAVPEFGSISANGLSYAGVAFTTGVQENFIDRLSPEEFSGTIGFDSFGATQTFAGNIDLGNLYTMIGLGSSTTAIITGNITTTNEGTDPYRFGGGGGTLYVASDLVGSLLGVEVTTAGSVQTPTTVVLQGNNSYEGEGVWVSSGILIFDGPNALPAWVDVALTQAPNEYGDTWDFAYGGITENAGLTPAEFLSRIMFFAPQPILGLDSANPGAPRTITDDIDLTEPLAGRDGVPIFVGTATGVTLAGELTTGAIPLGLTGLKGAELTVSSILTDANIGGLLVGLDNIGANVDGTVRLTGANTFTTGTTWQSGDLILGNASALGTGTLKISTNNEQDVLDYTGDFTVANEIVFDGNSSVALGSATSLANLTLTGAIRGASYAGFDYLGGGTLTYAGTATELGWLTIDAAPGGKVVYARPGALSRWTELETGGLVVQKSTNIMYLTAAHDTTIEVAGGATLGLLDNNYGEGPVPHHIAGSVSGDGGLRVLGSRAGLFGQNSYTGGTALDDGTVGFTHDSAFGTGQLTVENGGGGLLALASDLTLDNAIELRGELEVGGSNYFYYYTFLEPGNRDLTLAGTITGEGSLWKYSGNTLTLSGNNSFAGGITINQGTVIFTHDHAAGTGLLSFDPYETGAVAHFTTAAPVIGGLTTVGGDPNAEVRLATASTLTINQAWDSVFYGAITGSGAAIMKTGAGYLQLAGVDTYGYDGGTTITGGGIIFNDDSLLAGHAAGSIHVGTDAYAGLGAVPTSDFTAFLAKIDPTSMGTVGIDGYRTVASPVDLTGHAGIRLGSSSEGALMENATIIPAGDVYRFGGGGGHLALYSTLTGGLQGLDLASPATQPLTLWLLNNNYFGGPMTVTNSAAIFGPLSISYINNIQLGAGGYVGSTDPQLTPAELLSHFAPGTGTGMIGFDEYLSYGRTVGAPIDLAGFGPGVFLGTSTNATLRGPITLPGGVTSYNFGAYKGGTLTVATPLEGTYAVVIGDPYSLGTMRDPHSGSRSTVVLTGINTYSGGTVLNAGTLVVDEHSLGTGALTVQPNSFPATSDPGENFPQFEVQEAGAIVANAITLNGWLRIGGGVEATLAGAISGVGGLYVDRYDYQPLTLSGTNTYTGGTVIESGNVLFTTDAAFGSGTITTMDSGGLITGGGPRALANDIHVSHLPGDRGTNHIHLGGYYDLTLNGAITFDTGTSYVSAGPSDLGRIPLLRINGGMSGDSQVVFETQGMVWISGTNTYTGGTTVSSGQVIFDSVASIPAIGNLDGYNSYIGLATPTANLQGDYISRFKPNVYGRVIGFDSSDAGAPNTFTGNIDLTSFYGAFLSSATSAILTGTITTPESNYLFSAAGGGVLTVASSLTGDRGVRVENYNQPFLLQLAGNNSFTGEIQANGSGIVFVTADSLPEEGQISPNTSTGSYFGIMDPELSLGSLLNHFDPYASHAVIGFDSVDVNSPRTITSPDLSYFEYYTEIYLGTATRAIIDGTITWPALNTGYAFASYRTGWLTVNSVLDGGFGVIVGNGRQRWTVQEVNGAFPTVELAGDNSYSGNTQFNGGQLVLSHANALGTGTLNVWDAENANEPVHRLLLNTPTVGNTIILTQSNQNLEIATTQGSATLSGSIAGDGSITKVGAGTISLSGANSFAGTVTIAEGAFRFDHASATGTAGNTLRFAENGGLAHFTTGTPVIGHLESERGVPATVELDAGVNLTVGVYDAYGPMYSDHYHGTITGAGSLTKDGQGALTLHGASSYTGGTTINQGTLVADNATALGTGAVTLNGGELALGHGVVVNNVITFGGAGGKLSGSTTFTGAVTLGASAGLSPGNSPGTMTFGSDLTLSGSSFLDFEIQDPTGAAGSGYDTLVVSGTLFVNSTPETPFVINLLSLDGMGNSGQLELSNPNTTYSLLVISAGAISGFAPENFTLNTTGFSTNFGTDFQFNLFQSGNEIRLDFTAVPEPSTYALLGLGALLLGITRRRAARR